MIPERMGTGNATSYAGEDPGLAEACTEPLCQGPGRRFGPGRVRGASQERVADGLWRPAFSRPKTVNAVPGVPGHTVSKYAGDVLLDVQSV